MLYKKLNLKARDWKMCSILLFTLVSFFILDYSYLNSGNFVYNTSFASNYWDYYNEIPLDSDSDKTKRAKSQYDKSYDTISLSDTMIKNAFVAFKFVQDEDGNDNESINIFSKLKNETITLDTGVIFSDFDLNIFKIKFWYQIIIWKIICIFFIECIAISVKNIIYIHKSDGKKGNIVSTHLSAI